MRRLLAIAALVALGASGPQTARPVLVELFTSQGCSSCPPADDLLAEVAHDASLRGRVITLAFHVDYWDRLGWRDPYSSRQWTARQAAYVGAMHLASAYTPQIVVDGDTELIGSNRGALMTAIDSHAHRPADASLQISRDAGGVVVTSQANREGLQLLVFAVEDGPATRVGSGENGGRTLLNPRVVHSLTRAGVVARGNARTRLPVHVPRGDVVALLEDPVTLRVYAVADARR